MAIHVEESSTDGTTVISNKIAVTNGESSQCDDASKVQEIEAIECDDEDNPQGHGDGAGQNDGAKCSGLAFKTMYRQMEGKILLFLSGFIGAVVFSFSKIVPNMPIGQLSFINFTFAALFVVPTLFFKESGINFYGKAKYIIPRAFLGGFYGVLTFWSARVMDYGDSKALAALVPIFAALFSRVLWKEKLSIFTLVALVVGLAGIALIAKPTFLFGVPDETEKKEYSSFFPLVPLTASILIGLAYSLMRKVGTEVSPFLVSILVSSFSAVDGVVFQAIYRDAFVLPGCYRDRAILFAGGILLYTGLLFINRGTTLEKSGPGLLMKNSDIVFAYIIQIFFFNTVPDAFSTVGAVLVIVSIVLVTADKFLFKSCRFEF